MGCFEDLKLKFVDGPVEESDPLYTNIVHINRWNVQKKFRRVAKYAVESNNR